MADAVNTFDNELDLRNYLRLQNLLNTTSNEFLRQWFHKNWSELQLSEWENIEKNGDEFSKGPGRELYSKSKGIQKKFLQTGNINLWDLALLVDAVRCLEVKLGRQNNKNFDSLKNIRNKLAHLGNLEIQSVEFEKYWGDISGILISLGISQIELDAAKSITLQSESVSKPEDIVNETNRKKAEDLKEKGNEFAKENNYNKAISAYTKACSIPGLPSEYLAAIYSNRSLGFLRVGDFQGAKEDAKGAMHLRPNWWKGYVRLANAYLQLKKYDKALHHYEIALGMEPTASDVKSNRDHCRNMVAKLARSDHLDPLNFATSFEDIAERMNGMGGLPTNAVELEQFHKISRAMGTPYGICGEALDYLHGRGVQQNYEKAATLFAKAARKGSAEGLYNLAVLTSEGKGVQRNIPEATRMLREAAGQEPFVELLPGSGMKGPNTGVMESQHALGMDYEKGVGVEIDYAKAIEWYEKALSNGSGNSGNNLALMHLYGQGVPINIERAFQFWKVAALKGCVRAMENLASNYLIVNFGEAQKWCMLAVQKGSMTLTLKKNEFKLDESSLKNFKSEDFFQDLREELMQGPLKKFARPNKYSYEALAETISEELQITRRGNGNYRTQIILEHREGIKQMKSMTAQVEYSTNPGKFVPSVAADLIGLKPIVFKDMNEQKNDHVYEGFAIKLTIVEDAILGRPSIPLIGQDENGDIQRIFVYNYPQGNDTQLSLGYGCRITIINPYFRITHDKRPAIRIDDVSLLFANPKLRNEKRCRYCGQANGTMPCRKCRRVYYCSKLCLKKDSEELQHRLVCFKRM